jgi:hypothetical protein
VQAKADTSKLSELKEYIDKVIQRMQERKDDSLERKKKVGKQKEALLRLKRVMEARLRSESSASQADGLVFDASLDDDEALLRLMHGMDSNGRGAISQAELLKSSQLTAEMKEAFIAAFACNLEAVEEALGSVDAEEFGEYTKKEEMQGAPGCTFVRKASAEALFDALDKSDSGLVERASLDSLANRLMEAGNKMLASALTAIAGTLLPAEAELDFLDVKREARRVPRVTGPRVDWVRRIGLDMALARQLPPGTLEDGLAGARDMPLEEAKRAVDAFLEDARVKILTALLAAKEATGSKSAAEANSKFDGFQGSFATLKDFHAGAEASLDLGYPNPDTIKGIRNEHTAHPSARMLFKTPNYSIVTNMLIEYAWAIYENSPTDPAVKTVLDRAFTFIRKLIEARDGAEAASAKKDDELLFPGEVGDTFVESLVIFKFAADSPESGKEFEDKAREMAVTFLEKYGEEARGVAILDHEACMERISKGMSVRWQASSGQDGGDGSRYVGLLLPMSLARTEGIVEKLRTKVATALNSEGVTAEVVGCKTWAFCPFTGMESLRKWLEDQSLERLKAEVEQHKEWSDVTHAGEHWETHEQLCKAMEASFLRTELRGDLCSALEAASDAQIKALVKGWGLEPIGERGNWINQAAAVLDSEERWGEVEGWVRLHRGRIQGRTRLGLKALMEREKEKIELCNLTESEVLAGHIYTGANFVPLNAICRRFPQNMLNLLKGDGVMPDNRMCTTLFCISSFLKKLSQTTELPESRCPPLQAC